MSPDRVRTFARKLLAGAVVLLGALALGCVGEASASYRGIVTAGDSPGHEFLDLPAHPPSGSPPAPVDWSPSMLGPPGPRVEGARVVMHVLHLRGSGPPVAPCAADRWIARDAARPPKHPWPVTSETQIYEDEYSDEQGRFQVSQIFGGMLGSTEHIVLCVLHPDYDTYVYSAPYGETSDPQHGQKLLHVVLRRKPGP